MSDAVHQITKRSDENGFVSIKLYSDSEEYPELNYPEYFKPTDKVIASHTLSYIQSQIKKDIVPEILHCSSELMIKEIGWQTF